MSGRSTTARLALRPLVGRPHQSDAGNADQSREPDPGDQVGPKPPRIEPDSEADATWIPGQQDNGQKPWGQSVQNVREIVEDVQPDVVRVGSGDDSRRGAGDTSLDRDLGPHVVQQCIDSGHAE